MFASPLLRWYYLRRDRRDLDTRDLGLRHDRRQDEYDPGLGDSDRQCLVHSVKFFRAFFCFADNPEKIAIRLIGMS
jgi:hypothetical protein